MPTIDELDPALAATDSDLLPVSQAGILRRVSRSQVIAGLQPQLALSTGQLLGRFSAGTGAPETLSLGAGLVMSNGKIAATPTTAVDGVPAEAFGAKGDGLTDDTAALSAALASGKPVLLGPRTYVVNGQWTITQDNATLLGSPGLSTLKRLRQTGSGAWIAMQGDGFRADGVIFDANRSNVPEQSWGVLITGACTHSDLHRCAFRNAQGASLGSGLVIQSASAISQHSIRDCEFSGNAAHGLWVQAVTGVLISACRAHHNARYGINVDFNDAFFLQQARLVQVLGNRTWANERGIAVGNFNATNGNPATWGNSNPDALSTLVEGNICHDNTVYGIAVAGQALLVQGNLLSANGSVANSGAGILANVAGSRVTANMVCQSGLYGIDTGGSIDSDISNNQVQATVIGINCGGGVNNRVNSNAIRDCSSWAITVNNVETDGSLVNFGIANDNLSIVDNWITIKNLGYGIWLHDGPSRVLIARNNFVGFNPEDCLRADTDSVFVEGNRFNQQSCFPVQATTAGGLTQLIYPDIADALTVTAAPESGVQAIVSATQARGIGGISFVRVTQGGHGYSYATIGFNAAVTAVGPAGAAGSGQGGTGATAQAIISGGRLLGVFLLTPGSGYGPIGNIVAVTITGDGAGATAIAYAAPPLPDERRLQLRCTVPVRFRQSGSNPVQSNWSGVDLALPANADLEWKAAGGFWHARYFPPTQWLASEGTTTILRSQSGGDVSLRPSNNGRLRFANDFEPQGAVSAIGRGTPEGVISGPPGSDYRNLDGGPGATFWVKQQGYGQEGWRAIDGGAASIEGATTTVGHGSPIGIVPALPGSDYRNLDGGPGAVFWIKQAGADTLGWTPVGATASPVDGTLSVVGRGTPEGFMSAPPGSDYRNLDGGAGATFWVKQTGTGISGWIALA